MKAWLILAEAGIPDVLCRKMNLNWKPAGFFLVPEQQLVLEEFDSCFEIHTHSNEALNYFVNKYLLQFFNINKFHIQGGHHSKLSGLFQNKVDFKKHLF